jgi:2-hydroxychromene-2-carboxylate isomerase
MMKNNKINPIGLKGNQINERMKELMGITPINENKSTSTVELTKMGPDGNPYAIVRENREWYIKKADKTENLVAEDFKYIGGLQNKKMEAYPSYSAALKRLNLKFNSLAEAHNFTGEINIVENDNLLSEAGIAGFSEMTGSGFSNEGNMDHNEPLFVDEVELSEAEQAIEEMVAREELEGSDLAALRAGKKVKEGEEMSDKDKELAARKKPYNDITQADVLDARGVDLDEDKIAGAKMNEGRLSIAKLLESIEEEENAEVEVKKKV